MHPTYKRMLAGLERKKKASRRGKPPPKIGGVPPQAGKPSGKWSLYILKCGDGSFYTGITNDLERRFKMHQAGKASRYTRSHGPVEMLYSEKCGDRSSALIRECEVKEWPRVKKAALAAGEQEKRNVKRSFLKNPISKIQEPNKLQ
jgi:putative endonuclease